MFKLQNKRAIVTGGGSGIGEAISHMFASHRASVFILDNDEQRANAVASNIEAGRKQARALQCDVSSQASARKAIQEIIAGGGVDILVNNAGISHIGDLETTTEEDFTRVFDVNVRGFYNCMQACIGHMKERRQGVILNMASIAGEVGLANRFAYSMSKAAVISMTYSVARDYLQYNIRCNCISPARVHTPFVDAYLGKHYAGQEEEMFQKLAHAQPIGRMGEPREIAALALFLCSDEAGFITGTNYPIDGGALKLSI